MFSFICGLIFIYFKLQSYSYTVLYFMATELAKCLHYRVMVCVSLDRIFLDQFCSGQVYWKLKIQPDWRWLSGEGTKGLQLNKELLLFQRSDSTNISEQVAASVVLIWTSRRILSFTTKLIFNRMESCSSWKWILIFCTSPRNFFFFLHKHIKPGTCTVYWHQ